MVWPKVNPLSGIHCIINCLNKKTHWNYHKQVVAAASDNAARSFYVKHLFFVSVEDFQLLDPPRGILDDLPEIGWPGINRQFLKENTRGSAFRRKNLKKQRVKDIFKMKLRIVLRLSKYGSISKAQYR